MAFRKKKGSPLDLQTHLNQYVRSFLPPAVPHIKMEPGSMDGLNFNNEEEEYEDYYNDEDNYEYEENNSKASSRKREYGYKLDDFVVDEVEEENSSSDEDWRPPKLDGFGRIVKKRKFKSESDEEEDDEEEDFIKSEFGNKTNQRVFKSGNRPGRKRIIPGSLKRCSDCGEEADGPEQLVLHWSLEHPDKEPLFKCSEESCQFSTGDVDRAFKHRVKHNNHSGGGGSGRGGQDRNEKCKTCKRSYPKSYLNTQHYKIHEDKLELNCYVCNKVYTSVEELKAHSISHVPDEEKYVHCCELCGKR